MTGQPLISVVTPSYNQAQFLEATLRSVLEQDYPRLEYIVCDGGSTDGSADLIRRYADQFPGRLAWWYSQRDRGQAHAINTGLARATGDILAWLNSDDVYLPGALSAVAEAFARHPAAGVIYGDLDLIDERGRVIGRHPTRPYQQPEVLTQRAIIPQPAAFWRRAVSAAAGPLREDLHYAFDFDFWLRAGLRFPFVYLPQRLAQFRIWSGHKGQAASASWGPEFLRLLDDLYARPDLPADVARLKRAAFASAYYHGAESYLAALDIGHGRQWLVRAARLAPRYVAAPGWWRLLGRALLGRRLNGAARRFKARWARRQG